MIYKFVTRKLTGQSASCHSRRGFSTQGSGTAKFASKVSRTGAYLGAGMLVPALAWKPVAIENEVDEKKVEEGKAIAKHTGSSQKEDETKKEAVGRGNVTTKVPAEESDPVTTSEATANAEAAQAKVSVASQNNDASKGPDTHIKWDNSYMKPLSNGPCGGEFKDVFAAVYAHADLKAPDTVKKLEKLRGCLNDHPEIATK